MRLFIAIDLPDSIRQSVSQVRQVLDPGGRARWTRPESMHLTLKFLGETGEPRIEAIDRALRDGLGPAFKVSVSGVGFFPGPRAPRVLWAGVSSAGLAPTATAIGERMEAIGFPPERHPFRPHLTLARAPREGILDRRLVEDSAQFRDHEFGTFGVDGFALYESRLRPAGAEYTKLREYPLNHPS